MKKVVEGGKIYGDVVYRAGNIKQGLLKTGKFIHAVSHIEGDGESIGVLYTSKSQKQEDALIDRDKNTLVYAQAFGSNEIIPKNKMINDILVSLLKNRGSMDAIYANAHILNMNNPKVIFNDGNKQLLKNLEDKHIKKSEELLSKCGGLEKVNEAFEYNRNMIKILNDSKKFLYELSNADPSSRHIIYMKRKEIYEILNVLEKEKQLTIELFEIKSCIDKLIF